MPRESHVPLLLWVCAAVLVHMGTTGGADQIARVVEERDELRRLVVGFRERLRPQGVIEVTFDDSTKVAAPPPEEPRAPEPATVVTKDAPKPEPKKREPEAPKPPEPSKAKVAILPTPAAPAPPPPPPPSDHRIAVRQHTKGAPDENPSARFVADEANKVDEETVAKITSHDQDDPTPTPGGQHQGATPDPGNAEQTRVGDSETRAGDPTHAPGESARQASSAPSHAGTQTRAAEGAKPERALAAAPVRAPSPAPAGRTLPPVPAAEPVRETVAAESGAFRVDPTRPAGEARPAKPRPVAAGKLPVDEPEKHSALDVLGLGGGATASGVNLNLDPRAVVAAVGEDQLARERQADGERRRSVHRGSWMASGFERWRPAIENYVSSVKVGNTTALNAARVPFASYLNAIHGRIHPIFADDFLASLDGLPDHHPMNQPKLVTRLEIVLDKEDGRVKRMGVVRTSGVTGFDIAALDAVQRASPYGKPPEAIVSPDGDVYFHWEFHRDPVYACSTQNARPFLLAPQPGGTPPAAPPPAGAPGDPRERGAPPEGEGLRHGRLRAAPAARGRRAG